MKAILKATLVSMLLVSPSYAAERGALEGLLDAENALQKQAIHRLMESALADATAVPALQASMLMTLEDRLNQVLDSISSSPVSLGINVEHDVDVLKGQVLELHELALSPALPRGGSLIVMRAIGNGLGQLAIDLGPAGNAAVLAASGRLLTADADLYEAMEKRDGPAFSNAALVAQETATQLSVSVPLEKNALSRDDLVSTCLPVARVFMSALRRVDADAYSARGNRSALVIMHEAFENLGDFLGPMAGLQAQGEEALRQIVRPSDEGELGSNFGTLMRRITGLQTAAPADAGMLVESLLTPGGGVNELVDIGSIHLGGEQAPPISQIAALGLLGGDSGGGGLLSSLPIIGPILSILLNLLKSLPLVGPLLDGLLGGLI